MFNPKFFNPVRVFWRATVGVFCRPASDDSGTGWGKPFKDGDGNPINPPLGTPGGSNPFVNLIRKFTNLGNLIVARGQELPYPEETFDWRGLESSPNRGDMPFLIFGGPHARYFPTYIPGFDVFGNLRIVEQETTSALYQTYFWYRGQQIEGPGLPIRGGCIYNQNGSEPYFVVVVNPNRYYWFPTQTTGVQFWKRRVSDPDNIGWELIGKVGNGSVADPSCDLVNCFNSVGITLYDVPWHFNANGNKAVTCIQPPSLRPGDAGPSDSFNGPVRVQVQFDLNSVSVLEELEDGTQFGFHRQREWIPNPLPACIERHEDIQIDPWYTLVTSDYEYPNDNLVDFKVGVQGSSSTQVWQQSAICGCTTCPGGTVSITGVGQQYWEVGGQKFIWTEENTTLGKTVQNSAITNLVGYDNRGTQASWNGSQGNANLAGSANSAWANEIFGADLRFRTLGMILPLFGFRGLSTNSGEIPCNCYDNQNRFYSTSTKVSLGQYTYEWLYQGAESVLFKPSGIVTKRTDDDRRALFGDGTGPANRFGFSLCVSDCLTFSEVDATNIDVSEWRNGIEAIFRQTIPNTGGGGLAVDRFGTIFYSMNFSTAFFGGKRLDYTDVTNQPAFRWVEEHVDFATDYEYEGFDVDAEVGTTGANKRYHPIQST